MHDRRDDKKTKDLFFAASGLWGAIMETDNREARSVELLVTVGLNASTPCSERLTQCFQAVLAATYGAVSGDDAVRHRSNLLLCSSFTVRESRVPPL